MILSCSNITKSFGDKHILKQVSFHLEDHEKAAIVGINGAGKTTLLKIIIGELAADEGVVALSKGSTIGYLAQHQDLDSESTIYEALLEVKRPVIQMEERIRSLELKMHSASGDALEAMLAEYSRLNHAFELANGYAYKSEVTGVLPFPAVRKPVSPWASSCSPSRTYCCLTSRPTTWTWSPLPGWKPI